MSSNNDAKAGKDTVHFALLIFMHLEISES